MGHIKQRQFVLLIIGTVGLDIFIPNDKKARERLVRKRRQTWRKVFHAGILIEPHIPELEEFKEYFNDAIRVRYFFEGNNMSTSYRKYRIHAKKGDAKTLLTKFLGFAAPRFRRHSC